MSRRYRFLTNPRIFSVFTERKMNLVEGFLLSVFITITGSGLFHYLDSKHDKAREQAIIARFSQDLKDARAEVQRLKAKNKRNGTPRSTPALLKGASETETQTPAVHSHDHSDVSISTDTTEVVQSGTLKGLPLDVAYEIQEEYRAASIKRATQYHEWYQRRKALKERDIALAEKELAHGKNVLADSKNLREHILSVFANLSPEQLDAEREKALKTHPAEEVDLFFEHIAAYGTAKTPEQLEQGAQNLQINQETLAITREVLKVEREQIQREWEELKRTEIPSPNIDFNEFYTEWKERNNTKPTR